MLEELATVALTEGLAEHRLHRGDVVTILFVHGDNGYDVEFMNARGETIAVLSLHPHEVRAITVRLDRPEGRLVRLRRFGS